MNGGALIIAERHRQIDVEGYEPDRDDGYVREELARAAAAYATPWAWQAVVFRDGRWVPRLWPWQAVYYKPSPEGARDHIRAAAHANQGHWTAAAVEGRIRELVKAGALCAAEIDRLIRIATRIEGRAS